MLPRLGFGLLGGVRGVKGFEGFLFRKLQVIFGCFGDVWRLREFFADFGLYGVSEEFWALKPQDSLMRV